MGKLKVCFLILVLVMNNLSAQQSAAWEEFRRAKKNGAEAILPDFSYAGYHRGKEPIAAPEYKIFNVLDYGALPNDSLSDRAALEMAIAAAIENHSGIIYFPKGRYCFNTKNEERKPLIVKANHIIFPWQGRWSQT